MTDNFTNSDGSTISNSPNVQDLIQQISALKAHNTQLRNIIAKSANRKVKDGYKNGKPFDFTKCKFRHILLKFLYLGWDYHGYVAQEDTTNTIEHVIFEALKKTCLIEKRENSNYHRCGRTDKGVSSFSQVISLDVRTKSPDCDKDELDYCHMLNRVLPDDIQFVAWSPVDSSFSARFNCSSRTYKYYFPNSSLDVSKMRVAATYLIGTHDFRNLCKMDVGNGVVEFTRTINSVEITNSDNSMCVLTIKSKAFLWHQIRCIVGILLLVAQKKEEPEVIVELFDIGKNPRKPDYNMASEIPLVLYDCSFDDVEWIYSQTALGQVRDRLGGFWTFATVKSEMVGDMLREVDRHFSGDKKGPSDFLIQGAKSKRYTPVMKRQLCDSLSDKIQSFSKRKKPK